MEIISFSNDGDSRKEIVLANLPYLNKILPFIIDIILIQDSFGKVIMVHAFNERNFYVPKQKILGKIPSEVLPLDVGKLNDDAFKMIKKQKAVKFEYSLYVNNHRSWFESRCYPIITSGSVQGMISIIVDITYKKTQEILLKQKESILESMNYAANKFLENYDWEKNIKQILKHLANATDSGYAFLYKFKKNKNINKNIKENIPNLIHALSETKNIKQYKHYLSLLGKNIDLISSSKAKNAFLDKKTVSEQMEHFFKNRFSSFVTRQNLKNLSDGLPMTGVSKFSDGLHNLIIIPIFIDSVFFGVIVLCSNVQTNTQVSTHKYSKGKADVTGKEDSDEKIKNAVFENANGAYDLSTKDSFQIYNSKSLLSTLSTISKMLGFAIQRKMVRERLVDEMNKAKTYLNIAGSMIIALNKSGRVILVNKKGCSILGLPESEIIGKNWFLNFIPKRKRDEIRKKFDELMNTKLKNNNVFVDDSFQNEILSYKKDGSTIEKIILWKNSLLVSDNKVIGTLSSGEDITEMLKTQKALMKSEKTYRIIVSQTGQVIFDLDISSGRLDFYGAVTEMLENSLRGKDNIFHTTYHAWKKRIHPEDYKIVMKKIEQSQKNHEKYNVEYRLKTKSGYKNILQQGITLWENGIMVRMLGTMQNVTERKIAEEALKKRNQDLEKFNKFAVGRELRMIKLKSKLKKLNRQIEKLKNDR